MLIGGIEAGGTKFVCAVGDENGKVLDKVSFPTGDPDATLAEAKAFFDQHDITALGVGTFGPVDLNRHSDTYGNILNTPKTKWRNYPLLKKFQADYSVPVYLDTDVNAACLGEYNYGVSRGVDSCLYITVGTGIGAGLVQDGKVFQGRNHSEMGHILVQKHEEDPFEGACPSHGSCIEGLASGTAIEKRYSKKGIELVDNEKVWEIEAYYLAQAIMNYFVVLQPEKIILGGGVMKQEKLYSMIRQQFMELLNGYLQVENVNELIVAPSLEDEQGVLGAIALCE
ncbi:ROK family protein [Oceanobacillus halophilus]|uniref:fructokinase n=1 Tax=Oceanobacillus halophilus TaxID=930130 RepID=A0A494ZV31_9BACI|nr:ROK family protein [Oceanobacillus halophilus]RKQ30267.1 ROK family protein [Oceanobacillus halophilus]